MTGASTHRDVSPRDAISLFLKNFTDFQGRSSRGAYWWVVLANVGVAVVLNVLASILGVFNMVSILWSLAVLVPGIALSFRRMHDVDKSALWLLVAFIPIAGAAVLIWFAAQPGTRGPNQFGPDVEAGRAETQHLSTVFE